MFGRKQKVTLSKSLQMGIAGPSSQGTFFKVGGVFFLVLSLFLAVNVISKLNKASDIPTTALETQKEQVLGAFDRQSQTESSEPITYTVQPGDTLFNIAQKNGVNWSVIATLNNLKAPYNLNVGTTLKLK